MKRYYGFIAAALVCAGAGQAASFLAVNSTGKQKSEESCNNISCATQASGFLNISGEIALTPDEQANLVPSSSFALQYQGYNMDLPLSFDPAFETGDTSFKYTTTTLNSLANAQGTQSMALQWSNGVLRFQGSLKVTSASFVQDHSDTNTGTVLATATPDKPDDKNHNPNPVLGTVRAKLRNSNDDIIFDIAALVNTDAKETDKKFYHGASESVVNSSISIKSIGFAPENEF
jgi:hypothetical protein